jgi:hypothetical protein
MRRRTCAAWAIAIAIAAGPAHAQAPALKDVLYKMGNGLGVLRGVQELDSLMTVEYWGTAPGIKSYYAAVAYDFPGMRVDITRAAGASPREIQVVSGTFAWNEVDKIGGGLAPGFGSAVPAMAAVSERLLQMWTTPFGVYKAAVAAGAGAKVGLEGQNVVLTFPFTEGPPRDTSNLVVGELKGIPVKVTLDASSRPARVEVRFRDRLLVTTYSSYGDLNEQDYKADVFFPARIVQAVDGKTVLDLTIQKTNTYNPYVIMPVPENVR